MVFEYVFSFNRYVMIQYILFNKYIDIYQTLCIGNHAIDDKIDEDIQTFKKCIIKANIKEFIA